MPIYVVFFVVISLLIFFPALSLWIPGLMGCTRWWLTDPCSWSGPAKASRS